MYGRFEITNLMTGEIRKCNNTIVNVGKSMMAGLSLNDIDAGSAFDWLAIGTGSDTIVSSDVVLGAEYLKIPASGEQTTTTVTDDTATLSGTFNINASKILNEIGIFNKSGLNLGSMLARSTFADLTVESNDAVTAIYNITFS